MTESFGEFYLRNAIINEMSIRGKKLGDVQNMTDKGREDFLSSLISSGQIQSIFNTLGMKGVNDLMPANAQLIGGLLSRALSDDSVDFSRPYFGLDRGSFPYVTMKKSEKDRTFPLLAGGKIVIPGKELEDNRYKRVPLDIGAIDTSDSTNKPGNDFIGNLAKSIINTHTSSYKPPEKKKTENKGKSSSSGPTTRETTPRTDPPRPVPTTTTPRTDPPRPVPTTTTPRTDPPTPPPPASPLFSAEELELINSIIGKK
jgi:hypothetical protein